jgi:hypothetical protein
MHPKGWLFPGQHAGNPNSTRQLHRIVVEAARAAGIAKRVGPHTLRHSFASRLLEDGVDIRVIQVAISQIATRVHRCESNKMQHFAANRSRTKMLRSASSPQRAEVRDSADGSYSVKLDSLFRRFGVDGGLDSRISARR